MIRAPGVRHSDDAVPGNSYGGISPAFRFARERELGATLEAFAPATRGVFTTFVFDMTPFCVLFTSVSASFSSYSKSFFCVAIFPFFLAGYIGTHLIVGVQRGLRRFIRPRPMHAKRPHPSGVGHGIDVRPCDSTRISSTQAPHSTSTSPQLFNMPATSAPDDPQQTHDGGPRRTTETRDIPLSSATQLRAPPVSLILLSPRRTKRDESHQQGRRRGRQRTASPDPRSSPPPSTGRATRRLNRGRRGRDLESKSTVCFRLVTLDYV